MPPRVSIILTVYKRTKHLGEALDSVLRQSYRDFEIIVADDSGMAAARGIVETKARIEPRIRYQPNPQTLGIATSIVEAVKSAQGQFIAILNDDDLWEQECLTELVAPLEADRNLVLATSDHWIMNQSGEIDVDLSNSWSVDFGRACLPEGLVANAVEFTVLKGGPAINITSIFRKDAIDWSLLVPEVAGAYDYWISCLLAATRRPFYYVPKRLGRWRVHGAMETNRRSHDKNENQVYIYDTLLKREWFPELKAALKARLADALFAVGRDKLNFDRTREARSYLWRSFRLDHRPRVLIRAAASWLPAAMRALLKVGYCVFRRGDGSPAEANKQNQLACPTPGRFEEACSIGHATKTKLP